MTAALGIPANEANAPQPVWVQPLMNSELTDNDGGYGLDAAALNGALPPQFALLSGGTGACTMEQLNKNPVTDTYSQYNCILTAPTLAFFGSPFNTCASTWTQGFGPPISLDLTGQGNASNGKPNPAPIAATVPNIGSVSNFRSNHPNGGLFLLCDGSVQFINDSIDMSTYTGLSTMQGGELVTGAVGEP